MSFFGRVLAFYTVGVGLLDADWLQRVGYWTLIGWSLQRVTSLRHGALAFCRCKSAAARKRYLRLATDFKFGTLIYHSKSHPADEKPSLKGAWSWSGDPF